MNRRLRPVIPHLLELAAVILVLVGLVDLVRTFNANGYLPAPFVFDVGDTFMDWFNTAYWAHNPGAYSVWNTIYAPLSFMITGALGDPRCYGNAPYDARDCDVFGIVVIILMYLACVVVTAIALYRRDRSTALFRTVGIAIGGPMLFALERGNLIMVAYIGFVLLYGELLKTKAGIASTAAVLINMKSYLLFPVMAFAIKREWRTLELAGFATLAIYLGSLLIVSGGTPFQLLNNLDVWFNLRAGTIWDEVLYSTTYKPYLLFDVRQFPVRDFVDQRSIDIARVVIQLEVIASRTVAILCIVGAWFYPKVVPLHRLAFFILMYSFMGQNPGGYAIVFIVFLVFMERWKNFGVGLATICCYLVSIPTDKNISTFYQFTRESWLSGRVVESVYALPLGALIRPGLLIVVLWAIAIDTLIDLHRAAKAGRPALGLSLRGAQLPAPSPAPTKP